MASAEALPQASLSSTERSKKVRFLEQYRASEKTAPGINAIDFEKYKKKGVTTLLLGAEGTFIHYDGWNVDQEVIDRIKNSEFEHVAIVFNKKPKDERTFVKLNYWAHQIGADIVVTPESKNELKPHPAILEKALVAFNVRPDQALMVGDRTADIKAANAAGTYSVHVERYGKQDLVVDRLRHPLERGIGWRLKKEKHRAERESRQVTEEGADAQVIMFSRQEDASQQHLPKWTESINPALLAKSKIVNLGGRSITRLEQSQRVPTTILEKVYHAYIQYMRKHGREVATTITWARLFGTAVEVGLAIANKPKAARVANGILAIADGEGTFARMDERGGSEEGAILDPRVDKVRSAALSITQRFKKYIKTTRHAATRVATDLLNDRVREYYKRFGVDVKAILPSRIATGLVGVAENAAYSPSDTEKLQNAADMLKVARIPINIVVWERERRKLEREQEIFNKAKSELLAA
jgi:predicted HAD superfamily phosphohydrolase YqeG